MRLKRTGWVRSKVKDPERVSGHMFRFKISKVIFKSTEINNQLFCRMGIMALLIEIEENQYFEHRDFSDSAMVQNKQKNCGKFLIFYCLFR